MLENVIFDTTNAIKYWVKITGQPIWEELLIAILLKIDCWNKTRTSILSTVTEFSNNIFDKYIWALVLPKIQRLD